MRNAAATGLRRKASNHPSGEADGKRSARQNEKESRGTVSVGPLSEGIAQLVSSLQGQPEGSPNQARDSTDDDRENGQQQGIAAALRGVDQEIGLTFHSGDSRALTGNMGEGGIKKRTETQGWRVRLPVGVYITYRV